MLINVLQPYIDNRAVVGAVAAIASADEILDIGAIGMADIAAKRPMAIDTMFWIASVTKAFTGTAVMMLVESGDISLDEPVETYVPEFSDLWLAVERDDEHILLRRPRRRITVRDTLCHVSGLAFRSHVETPALDCHSLMARVCSYAMMPLNNEPGSAFEYSNAGTNTAGRVVECVSGKSFDTFLDERIFRPLGMVDTTFWPSSAQISRLATAYRPNETKTDVEPFDVFDLTYPLDDRTRRTLMPAGGLFSTVGDMTRFGRAIFRGGELEGRRILRDTTVAEMLTKQSTFYPNIEGVWALGWWNNGPRSGIGGMLSTNVEFDTATGLVYVYFIQHLGFLHDGINARTIYQSAADERFAKR